MFVNMKHLLLIVVTCAAAVESSKIYMRSAELQDQANAASGYVYSADLSGPTSYTHFHSGNLDHSGFPVITLGQSVPEVEPIHAPIQYVTGHGYDHPQAGSYQAESDDGHYNEDEGDQFVEEDGKKYDEANHASKGEKSESGYKNIQEYDKGSKGSYANEGDKGYYDKNGANKAGHYDIAEHHASNNEASKGAKSGSFSESKGHKKGSKTTGFHKLYHKDEYKKDHSFYDESDAKGHYDKFGNFHAHHSAEDGGYAKGAKSNSAYDGEKFAKKGHYDKGQYVDDNSGYKGEQGADKYYTDQSEYFNKGGQQSGKSFGYSEGDSKKY